MTKYPRTENQNLKKENKMKQNNLYKEVPINATNSQLLSSTKYSQSYLAIHEARKSQTEF
jgi:hypothetical protein